VAKPPSPLSSEFIEIVFPFPQFLAVIVDSKGGDSFAWISSPKNLVTFVHPSPALQISPSPDHGSSEPSEFFPVFFSNLRLEKP